MNLKMKVKTCFLFCLLSLFILTSGKVFSATGGPDDFGYTYADSEESGVTYEWIDISTMTPVTLNMGDDDESTAIAIGFPFQFYGTTYEYLYVHANGFVKFDAEVYDYYMGDQCPLPSKDDVNGMIAFFYRDNNPAEAVSGDIKYAVDTTSTPARFILEFDNIAACCSPWGGSGQADGPNPVSVQLVLYSNNEIQVNVKDPGPHQGADTTIGLEAPDAIAGINYRGCLINGSVLPETAIRFSPPTSGTPVIPRNVKKWGRPGDTLTYDFTVFNLEPTSVTINISESTSAWSPTLSTNTLSLNSGASSPFTLQVTIPSSAPEGGSDVSTLTFTPSSGTPVVVRAIALVQYAWTEDFWQQLPDVPMSLEMPAAATLGNYVYVIGGTRQDEISPDIFYHETAVHRYDVTTNRWESSKDGTIAELPEGRSGHGACGMNGKIYVMGGYGETGGEVQMAWDLFIYDEVTNTWTTGNPMPSARVEFAAVCDPDNSRVYAIGGIINKTDTSLQNAELTNDMVIYNVTTGAWTPGTPMNYYRYDLVAGLLDGETIIVAGNAYDMPDARKTEAYSITDDAWTILDDLTVVRATAAGGIMNSDVFCVAGGFNLVAAYGREDTFECFNGSYWIPQHSLLKVPRNNMASATLNGQIYAIAGDKVDSSGPQPTLVISNAFERYPHSPIPDGVVEEPVEAVADAPTDAEVEDMPAEVRPDAVSDIPTHEDVVQDVTGDEVEEGKEEEGGCSCSIAI